MQCKPTFLLLSSWLCWSVAEGAEKPSFDYFQANRDMIRNGVQAVLMCNGLFTSQRSLQQVFTQELAYMVKFDGAVGTVAGGAYEIDRARQAVAVGGGEFGTEIRAAFRPGMGCVVMAPEQRLQDIDSLPQLSLPGLPGDPATIPWPMGDLIESKPLPDAIDAAALQAASDWAFERESPQQVTLSLLVLHAGDIVHERYAPGVDRTTRTRTWSTAKSIAVTLIGMRNTLVGTDHFGDFIFSSQVYTNARDLARFGLLYLQNGRWQGERLISEEWIRFVRTPAPATAASGRFYGGQWWLVPDDRDDVPRDAYTTAGNRGQYVIVVPSHALVIVRRGLDFGSQGFDPWDLAREVVQAFRVNSNSGLSLNERSPDA